MKNLNLKALKKLLEQGIVIEKMSETKSVIRLWESTDTDDYMKSVMSQGSTTENKEEGPEGPESVGQPDSGTPTASGSFALDLLENLFNFSEIKDEHFKMAKAEREKQIKAVSEGKVNSQGYAALDIDGNLLEVGDEVEVINQGRFKQDNFYNGKVTKIVQISKFLDVVIVGLEGSKEEEDGFFANRLRKVVPKSQPAPSPVTSPQKETRAPDPSEEQVKLSNEINEFERIDKEVRSSIDLKPGDKVKYLHGDYDLTLGGIYTVAKVDSLRNSTRLLRLEEDIDKEYFVWRFKKIESEVSASSTEQQTESTPVTEPAPVMESTPVINPGLTILSVDAVDETKKQKLKERLNGFTDEDIDMLLSPETGKEVYLTAGKDKIRVTPNYMDRKDRKVRIVPEGPTNNAFLAPCVVACNVFVDSSTEAEVPFGCSTVFRADAVVTTEKLDQNLKWRDLGFNGWNFFDTVTRKEVKKMKLVRYHPQKKITQYIPA